MSFISEFKAFAVRGNMVDMAVGIIIGAAFGKIVSSLVGDVIMPPLGVLIGGVDFSDLAIVLKEAVGDTPAVVLAYGKFIQSIIAMMPSSANRSPNTVTTPEVNRSFRTSTSEVTRVIRRPTGFLSK